MTDADFLDGDAYNVTTSERVGFDKAHILTDFTAPIESIEANTMTPTFMDTSDATSRLFTTEVQLGSIETVASESTESQYTDAPVSESTSTSLPVEEPRDFSVANIETVASESTESQYTDAPVSESTSTSLPVEEPRDFSVANIETVASESTESQYTDAPVSESTSTSLPVEEPRDFSVAN
ncbi:unnamed protein product, partial [Hydatigera taeniaeformis]|uniref:Flocculation protein FLO11-like n=1 Tax=Hydatigena taeniaeformis TaxID=6205 RepID=A0A0R3WVV4_HYDTA